MLIIVLGITALTYADTVTTTIGENISTNSLAATGLTVSGNATTTGNLTIDTDTLYVDAENNRVGIGTTSPTTTLDIISSSQFGVKLTNPIGTTEFVAYNNDNKYASFGVMAYVPSGDVHLFSNKGIFAASQGFMLMTDGDNGQGGSDAVEFRMGGYRMANLIMKVNYTGLVLGKNYNIATATPPANGVIIEGNVGIGTTAPKATLDINGFMKMTKQSSAPETCVADYDGAIALTSTYRACVCNGTNWVYISDGITDCVWE